MTKDMDKDMDTQSDTPMQEHIKPTCTADTHAHTHTYTHMHIYVNTHIIEGRHCRTTPRKSRMIIIRIIIIIIIIPESAPTLFCWSLPLNPNNDTYARAFISESPDNINKNG